jgi:hypothetical protein
MTVDLDQLERLALEGDEPWVSEENQARWEFLYDNATRPEVILELIRRIRELENIPSGR